MRTIDQIEIARRRARVTKKELCDRAGVHVETYRRITRMTVSPTLRTLSALDRALESLTEEARA